MIRHAEAVEHKTHFTFCFRRSCRFHTIFSPVRCRSSSPQATPTSSSSPPRQSFPRCAKSLPDLNFSNSSSTLLASTLDAPTAHKSFVRLIATYVEPATKQEYVVSTSEDKLLFVWKLPALELVCSRELARRANGLAIAENGDIAVGDKFGDVFLSVALTFSKEFQRLILPLYRYPLLAPSTELKSEPNGKKATPHPPILGHVSMLTALVLVPIQLPVVERSYIITGDRDEHVRLSRWPQGYVIDKFFFGNKRSVQSDSLFYAY